MIQIFVIINLFIMTLVTLLVKKDFHIMLDMHNISINFIVILVLMFFIVIIIVYKEYKEKYVNQFYYNLSYLFSFMYFIILYICCIKVFLFTENITDYLIETKYFKIQIVYSLEYKILYLKKMLLSLAELVDLPEEKIKMLLQIIPNLMESLFIENPRLTLIDITHYLSRYIIIVNVVYDNIFYLSQYFDIILFQTTFIYNFMIFIKNSLFIYVFINTLLTLPCDLMVILFFKSHLPQYIYDALLSVGVTFDMTELEIKDFCEFLSVRMLQRWNSTEIIKFIFRNDK